MARDVRLPGGRADVRDRSTTVAMHLLRRLLRGEAPRAAAPEPGRRGRGCSWRSTCPRTTRRRWSRGATRCWRGGDGLRPVAPEALHVTLVFLGYLPEKEIPRVASTAFEALEGLSPPRLCA